MKKRLLLLGFALCVGFVFFVWGGSEQELGDGYYYLPAYEAVDMGYPGGPIVYQSTERHSFSRVLIDGDLQDVNKNGQFILAVRQPPTPLPTAPAASSAKPGWQYFIVAKASGTVYGPYTGQEYARKREELGVPRQLQLAE